MPRLPVAVVAPLLPAFLSLGVPLAGAAGQAVRMRAPGDATRAVASVGIAALSRASWYEGGRPAQGPSGQEAGWLRSTAVDLGATALLQSRSGRFGAWTTGARIALGSDDEPRTSVAAGLLVRRGRLMASLAFGQDVAYRASARSGGDSLDAFLRDSIARGLERPLPGGGWATIPSAEGGPTAAPYQAVRVGATVASLQWTGRRAGARLFYGVQVGAGSSRRPWGGADVDLALGGPATLVAAVERRAVRAQDGEPPRRGALAVHLGVRFATVPWSTARPTEPADPPTGTAPAARAGARAARFVVHPMEDGVLLRLRLPGARQAEVAGDLTQWETVSLRAAGDAWWEVVLPARPGVHRIRLRVDGGEWMPPPSLPIARDEFGETAGLFVLL